MRYLTYPRRYLTASLICGLGLTGPSICPAAPAATPAAAANQSAINSPENPSYEIGLMLGNQLEHSGLAPKLTAAELIRGLKDGIAGHPQTPEEREATLHLVRSSHESLADANRAAAREFLARNGKSPDIHSMPSGLQYRVLSEGDPSAKAPSLTDEVTVRYRASLLDGHEFDRSETHDHPANFRVGSTLKGWQEAFLAMKPGAKWQLFVPPELGYGSTTPPGVPPGSLIVYDLELLKIEPAPPVDPAMMRHVPRAAEEQPAGLAKPTGSP